MFKRIFLITFLTFILVGCVEEEEVFTHYDDLVLEDISFERADSFTVFISGSGFSPITLNTDKKTFVVYDKNLKIHESENEISKVNVIERVNEETRKISDFQVDLFLSKADLKEISKKYVDFYGRNITISE